MHALNGKELEFRDSRRKVLPVLRRRMSRAWDIATAFTWYQLNRLTGGSSTFFVPPDRLPPMYLRRRVNGLRDIYSFLAIGKTCCDDIVRAVESVGREPASFGKVLDFGCGCGRTAMWMADRLPGASLVGTDCDEDAIAWCREHLPGIAFDLNDVDPPLEYPADTFDLIYVVSLFSHFDEPSEAAWAEELARVTAPGGVVVATFHGEYCWHDYPEALVTEVREKGFAYLVHDPEGSPSFQTSYHTEAYVRDLFGKHFRVLAYVPRGLNRHQDLVVLEKP